MSPLSWPVVVGTLILGSPALWAAEVSGTLSPDVALVRLGVCLLGVWAACSLVTVLTARVVAANDLAATADDAVLEATPVLTPDTGLAPNLRLVAERAGDAV